MADNPSIAYKTTPGAGDTALTVAANDSALGLVQRVSVGPGSSTATLSNVSGSASSVTLKAANTSRLGLLIFNDSSAVLYVKFGATASTTSFTVLVGAGQYYEMPAPIYTGVVDGIWASATGAARVTELTD